MMVVTEEVECAKKAYEAYGNVTYGKNFRGGDMPLWDELPHIQQSAWVAAIATANACFDTFLLESR